MADTAIMIDKEGIRTTVRAVCLKREDYENDFVCAGISDEGSACEIPMSIISETERRKRHFGARCRTHINGCPFDEKRKKITVEMLDRSGKGKTTQDIFNRLNKDKKERRKPSRGGEHPPEGEIEPDMTEEEYEEEEREIQSKERPPQTVQELVMILQSLDTKDYYADKLVFDQILDARTIEAYRGYSLPTGKPFIITARKTSPYSYFLDNNQWALVDYWSKGPNAYEPFVFILTVTPGAKQKLYNLCQQDPTVKIQVYVILKKHPTLPNTYISELVKAHMICASFDDVG